MSQRHPFSTVACFRRFVSRDKNLSLFWSLHLSEVILWCWNCINDLKKFDLKLSSLNVRTTVVYRDGSSHISGGATGGATGSDRVRMRNRKCRWSRDRKWWFPPFFSVSHAFFGFPHFFLTIVVVQNVPLRTTGSSMATGCDVSHVTPRGFHWEDGVRACAIGSCEISALVGPFHRKWRHQTTPEGGSPRTVSHVIGSGLGVWSYLFSKSYNIIIFYELALSLVICPFPVILFSWERLQ